MVLSMDGVKSYMDQKMSYAAMKKFPKDEVEKAKLAKGSHTYYSPKVIKLISRHILFIAMEFITLDGRYTRVYSYTLLFLIISSTRRKFPSPTTSFVP